MAVKKTKDSTEEAILAAARKVFIRNGMAGARMQEIANEAGINKALLHYYFRSKDKLFRIVFEEAAQHFIPRMISVLEQETDLFSMIERFCNEYIDGVMKDPFIPLFVVNEINRHPDTFFKNLWGRKKPNYEKFAAQVKDCVKQGIIKDINPVQLIMNMLSLCVFPFLSRPMIQKISSCSDKTFMEMMKARKKEVPHFIIEAIKIK